VRELQKLVADGADASAAAAILEQLASDLRSPFEKESKLSSKVFQSEDAKEGPRAFAEKRPPVWRGR